MNRRVEKHKYYRQLVVALLIVSIALGLFYIGIRITEWVALRPIAEQLNTEPSKDSLIQYVELLLQQHEGANRDKIHALLDSIGSFHYQRYRPDVSNQTREEAWWTMAELPLGFSIGAVWVLYYDSEDRFVKADLVDLP